ncbi:hypothetical protein [uncultured Anaerococcus sp.]|uniref:hypothetical protein n=1 Tax=uncultured Anaerococcus sp. TaxID=293428 RepID=UPI00288C2994|nr:hypothetical protein [uncultured Anaerococcus sp.]
MENKLFLIFLIIFACLDLYKLLKKDLNFFSFFRPLSLAISSNFILDGIDDRLNVIALIYFLFLAYIYRKNLRKEEDYEKEI